MAKTITKETAVKAEKYVDLITKSTEVKDKEMIALEVSRAKNTLEQATLSVQGQLLKETGEVKSAEIKVANAELVLNKTKGAKPFNPQAIITARGAVKQAEADLDSAIEKAETVADTHTYLVKLAKELF